MSHARLRIFVIASVIIHILAFSIWAFVWRPEVIVTNAELIDLGVIGASKEHKAGGGNIFVPSQKAASKVENAVIKPITRKNQEKEITNKREASIQHSKLMIEPSTVNKSDYTNKEQTHLISNTSKASAESLKEGTQIGYERLSVLGTDGSGQAVEVGYPDYKINPKPGYPIIARRNGYEGAVLLKVWVLEDGKVGKIEIEQSSGHEILDKSAIEAVTNWIFMPGKRNGVPLPSWVTVPIKFQLRGG
ncbi:MAG TPA: energy transducer TonB [Thermodesulfobacteriota bacterium]|nr:energy transducer TonB [Thermodesulfobacteriota bacterium]HZX13541.1 energy transducer TonB [Thermodesulfobacteriota bacterium]